MSKRPSKPAPLAIDAKLRELETARAAVIAEILVLERKGAKDV